MIWLLVTLMDHQLYIRSSWVKILCLFPHDKQLTHLRVCNATTLQRLHGSKISSFLKERILIGRSAIVLLSWNKVIADWPIRILSFSCFSTDLESSTYFQLIWNMFDFIVNCFEIESTLSWNTWKKYFFMQMNVCFKVLISNGHSFG